MKYSVLKIHIYARKFVRGESDWKLSQAGNIDYMSNVP